jgi:hypothetical protein
MTALSAERMGSKKTFQTLTFTLTEGTRAYKNGLAVLVLGAGTVSPGTAATGRVAIGRFAQSVDATLAALPVEVELSKEIEALWWAAHTVGAPATTDIGSICYVQDDQTVTMTSTGRSPAGRVWAVDATLGVLVEPLPIDSTYNTAVLTALQTPLLDATLAFTAANCAVAAGDLIHGTVFPCPATEAASTITLATTDVDTGTAVTFVFDGTANDFDVAIRYSTTNIVEIPAGTVAAVRCVKHAAAAWTVELGSRPLLGGALTGEVENDVIVTAAEVIHGAVYSLPTLEADSTVTLPVTGVAAGTIIYVDTASPGNYTVTYRYGTTNISAATTVSVGHTALLICRGETWGCIVQSNAS